MILTITFIITAIATAYAFMKTPIYEVKSNVQIGHINGNLLDNGSSIVKTLNIIFHVDDKVPNKKKFVSDVVSIEVNKKNNNFIEIKTDAISNEEALKKNKEVLIYLQNLYQQKIDLFVTKQTAQIENTKKAFEHISRLDTGVLIDAVDKLKIPDEMLNGADNIIKQNKKSNSNSATISSIQIMNYKNIILNYQNKIDSLEQVISKMNTDVISKKLNLQNSLDVLKQSILEENIQNSKVIGDYIMHGSPIKPKKKSIVVVAFVTGLILSIFLVFFLEFIKGFKEEENHITTK